ncbi:MAG: pyruvoyl-dependent arginine decarboxylase [Halobacteriaceae archaeon]
MTTVTIVAGAGTGPTGLAAYDAALGECGLENYNLVRVSSVLPAAATVETGARVGDIGPVGSRVTVVEARATVAAPNVAGTAIAWTTSPEGGLLYEGSVTDPTVEDPATAAAAEAATGLEAGMAQRDWTMADPAVETAAVSPTDEEYGTAVVVAVLGTGDPID